MRVVIIGNSAAAVGAIESMRQYDQGVEILVISEEPHLIYSRPLLSHYLGGDIDKGRLAFRPSDFYMRHHVQPILDARAVAIDVDAHHVKLASGEHEPDDSGFNDLINSKVVDYVQMDILCQGGFSTAQRIFEGLSKQGLRFAFHSWGTALEVLTAAQLGVCWPENVVEWLEYPCYFHRDSPVMYPFPLADEILSESLEIENGYLVLPDGHGMGIKINENVIEKYPFIQGPWSTFKLDSTVETIAVTGDHSVKWIKGNTS